MPILQSILLGAVQGLGEFLPVSSSGHLLLCRLLLGIETESPAMKMLDILLHVATLIPVIIIFWNDWLDMILHPIRNKTLVLLIIASLPTLCIYLLAKKVFPEVDGFSVFENGWFLGISFLLTSLFLLVCDRISLSGSNRSDKKVGILQALVMGLFQGIGMIPGISRSGSTIFGGVSSGLNKSTAAKFSFMMSAPAILGSLLMEGKKAIEAGYIQEIEPVSALAGMIVAAVVGFVSIRFMLKLISRIPLAWFALYLAIIGILFLVMQLSNSSVVPPLSFPIIIPQG